MIEARQVSKWFGKVRAVREVSFVVPAGQIVGLLGPNGAGKTTTIRMITGFTPPSRGRITVCGHDTVENSQAARRAIGYLPEATPLYPEMRVRDYLAYRARLFSIPRADRIAAIARRVEQCELGEVVSRRIGHLSKGFKQRVGIAAALIHNPPVLVLDEPTSGLDPSQVRQARSLIRDLAEERTVLVSSHILPEVERTCDRVIIIAAGQVRADGTPAELVAARSDRVRLSVELDITPDGVGRAAEILAGVPGVKGVTRPPAPASSVGGGAGGAGARAVRGIRFDIDAGDADPRSAIAQACVRLDLAVLALARETPTLEQLFVSIIEDDAGASTEAAE